MDYLFLENFAVTYGIHTIILSVLICILRLILKRAFCGKISDVTRSYIEMAFGVISEFFYTLIFFGDLSVFTFKSVSSALLSYSLSLVIYSILNRIIKGKTVKVSAKTLIIEGVLSGYVEEEKLSSVSKTIAKAIDNGIDEEGLLRLLADNLSRPADDEEILALKDLILSSVKKI